MGKLNVFKRFFSRNQIRGEPAASRTGVWLCGTDAFGDLTCGGYTSLDKNPEITAGVDTIARLVASMTIHLMENTEGGDIRVRNQLSRKVDIDPHPAMTRSTLVHWIVRALLLEGDGNAVVFPVTRDGLLDRLQPIPPAMVSFLPDGWDYMVGINGQRYGPEQLLHFVLAPDPNTPWKGTGCRVALRDVADNLRQAANTEKGFLASKWKPSLIVKVDALTEEFSSPEGRRKLLESYVAGSDGEPWLIPAEQFDVEQVKPLTLADLALADVVTLDKRTVASILGLPPFVLGIGEFDGDAWNNFIDTRIMPLARTMEQELSRKLLHHPSWFFRFNARSLYNYDLKELAAVADDQYVRGIMTGNEVRDWLGMSPREGLDELIILENYIPRGMIGEQNKLNGGE